MSKPGNVRKISRAPWLDPALLRAWAEEETPQDLESRTLSSEEAQRALHELRVRQIELEMQNEQLREAHAALDVSRARYFDLFDLAPVGYCTISPKGLILKANLTAATMLGTERRALTKWRFSHFIQKRRPGHLLFPPQTSFREQPAASMRAADVKKGRRAFLGAPGIGSKPG